MQEIAENVKIAIDDDLKSTVILKMEWFAMDGAIDETF